MRIEFTEAEYNRLEKILEKRGLTVGQYFLGKIRRMKKPPDNATIVIKYIRG